MRHPATLRSRRTAAARALAAVAVLTLVTAAPPPGHAYTRPGATTRISTSFQGGQAQGIDVPIGPSTWDTAITPDGRFIAFTSSAVNLVPGDVNGLTDVFVWDRVTRRTEMVSVASDGTVAAGACSSGQAGSFTPSISANGRWVSFTSCATNLVPGDTNLTQDGFVRDRATGRTERVSLSSDGKQGTTPVVHSSAATSISDDGRFVVIGSTANNLVPGDTNGVGDVFVYDRTTDTIERVSVSSEEVQGAAGSGSGTISGNGRFVAFSSYSDNLVPGDTNRAIDVFVRDRQKGTTERISVRTGGAQTNVNGASGLASSGGRGISGDGRYVMFSSNAGNLVPNDTNGIGLVSTFDMFVHDRVTKRTERISVGSDGREAIDDSNPGAISRDGRYVTLGSTANNLVDGDTGLNGNPSTTTVGPQPGDMDVFIYDRKFGTMEMLSVAPDGTQAKGHCGAANAIDQDSAESFSPAVDADGEYVVFQSCAKNLVPGDTNNGRDQFLRFRGPHLGTPVVTGSGRSSVTLSGWSTFSGAVLAAATDPASDGALDAATGGGEIVGGELLYRPEREDFFWRLDLTQIPAAGVGLGGVTAPGDPRVLYGLRFVASGVSYEVRVHRTGVNTSNPLDAAFGLFECTEQICTEVAALRGGYGTTSEEIVVAIPLAEITKDDKPIGPGAVLSTLRSYTAYGTYYGGPTQLLDQVNLTTRPSVTVPKPAVSLTVGSTTRKATPVKGRFSATFPRSLFRGATPVRVRTCLGSECRSGTISVRV